MDERPSGWYDDPNDPSRLRYWDGQAWTERTHDKAPIPAPQPPRAPVSRLRPPREATPEQPPAPAAGEHSVWSRLTPSRGEDSATSPRPWSTTTPGSAPVDPAPGVAPDGRRRAGYLRRAVAVLVDFLLVWTLASLAIVPFVGDLLPMMQSWADTVWATAGSGATPPNPPQEIVAAGSAIFTFFAVSFVAYDLLFHALAGATPGKFLTGLRVRDAGTGAKPGLGAALRRAVVKWSFFVLGGLPLVGLLVVVFAVVDHLTPLWDPKDRALHDRWSATEVVTRR